jgi:hypothetical protein
LDKKGVRQDTSRGGKGLHHQLLKEKSCRTPKTD